MGVDNPSAIDEWQEVTTLRDEIRSQVDRRGENGLFILTGSSTSKKEFYIVGLEE